MISHFILGRNICTKRTLVQAVFTVPEKYNIEIDKISAVWFLSMGGIN